MGALEEGPADRSERIAADLRAADSSLYVMERCATDSIDPRSARYSPLRARHRDYAGSAGSERCPRGALPCRVGLPVGENWQEVTRRTTRQRYASWLGGSSCLHRDRNRAHRSVALRQVRVDQQQLRWGERAYRQFDSRPLARVSLRTHRCDPATPDENIQMESTAIFHKNILHYREIGSLSP